MKDTHTPFKSVSWQTEGVSEAVETGTPAVKADGKFGWGKFFFAPSADIDTEESAPKTHLGKQYVGYKHTIVLLEKQAKIHRLYATIITHERDSFYRRYSFSLHLRSSIFLVFPIMGREIFFGVFLRLS